MGDAMTDSGVDSELSPSSPDSVTETRTGGVTEVVTGHSAEELVARMEEDEEKFVIDEGKMGDPDKMETVEALLSLGESSRSGRAAEKPLITLLPAHSPDTGEQTRSETHFNQTSFSQIHINSNIKSIMIERLGKVNRCLPESQHQPLVTIRIVQ